ncbi:carbohydrate porin [Ralstonia sp. VS2407]
MYFRPNLQYILHPDGTSQNKNAFVIRLTAGKRSERQHQ